MKILILSPLFPPDTGAPASYVKELATRLEPHHTVTIHIYGYLPEHVHGVTIVSTDKRTSLPHRLFLFTRTLFSHREKFDLILVNNAPSVELPFLFFWLVTRVPYVLIESDPLAKKNMNGLYKCIHSLTTRYARYTLAVEKDSYQKAELLPFTSFDTVREEARSVWWDTHIKKLVTV